MEAVVSIYEDGQSKKRTPTDDRNNHEMLIAFNGPSQAKADIVLERALNKYFRAHKHGKWNFTIDPTRHFAPITNC